MCHMKLKKWQPGALKLPHTQRPGRGPTILVYCTQPYPVFTQEAISRTWTPDLPVTWQQLYQLRQGYPSAIWSSTSLKRKVKLLEQEGVPVKSLQQDLQWDSHATKEQERSLSDVFNKTNKETRIQLESKNEFLSKVFNKSTKRLA